MACGVAMLVAGSFLAGCSNMRKLAKNDPRVGVAQPRNAAPAFTPPTKDTASAPKIITFKKQDGTELFFAPVEVDDQGEKMMSVAIDEVVISTNGIRRLAERNGKINVEFVVTVPASLQASDWQLVLVPQMRKSQEAPEPLEPLVYRGSKFDDMQAREYARYDEAQQGLLRDLRRYVLHTDDRVTRSITYRPDANDKFDHLNDYFTARYRFGDVDVLPGGKIYTRVKGEYPVDGGREREAYVTSLADTPARVQGDVKSADGETVRRYAAQRLGWTDYKRSEVNDLLMETDQGVIASNLNMPRSYAVPQEAPSELDELIEQASDRRRQARHNEKQEVEQKVEGSPVFTRIVHHPYFPNARLDTVIYRPDNKVEYHYTEQVQADENSSKLYLYLTGGVENRSGRRYYLKHSDTLTYNVSSMTSFLDERTRYMHRILLRDAEANARFFFTFPKGKSHLVDTLPENRTQIRAVRDLTHKLMTDPVYIIDSITLRATSSPEGTWAINDRLARERAEALRSILNSEFRVLYDSLKVSASVTLDDEGHQVVIGASDEGLPDLPNLLRTKSLAEDWDELRRLVQADTTLTAEDKEGVVAMMDLLPDNPDLREYRIRSKFPKAYQHMREVIYPQMRAVDFRFNLHRRGMKQDTVYTTEVDTAYMRAVELLKKRRYEQALEILRPYEDRNTALAYMSTGYDAAAYRILRAQPDAADNSDIQYMLAILAARLGDEEQAVQYFLRAVELKSVLKFRGNLDPEISVLINKYGLDKEESGAF